MEAYVFVILFFIVITDRYGADSITIQEVPNDQQNPNGLTGRTARSLTSSREPPRRWIIDYESFADAFTIRRRRFHKREVTWRISRFFNRTGLRKQFLTFVIKSALETWSAVIPVEFRQITNERKEADLDFRFLDSDIDDRCNNTFPYDELAHCTRRQNPVGIHFNGDISWDVGEVEYDIFTVALHEIGHALGLAHSTDSNAVMFGSHSRTFENLTDDDIRGIQSLYGKRSHEPIHNEIPVQTPTPTATPISGIVTITSTITKTENGTESLSCEPGREYCGWQMKDMGYKVETSNLNNVYRCTGEITGAYLTHCEVQCILDASHHPSCTCKHGDLQCGYFVMKYHNTKPGSYGYQRKYRCTKMPDYTIWTEVSNSKCGSDTACDKFKLYCGYEILENRFILFPNQSWQFHALYRCTNPYAPVEVCDGKCDSYMYYGSPTIHGRCSNRYIQIEESSTTTIPDHGSASMTTPEPGFFIGQPPPAFIPNSNHQTCAFFTTGLLQLAWIKKEVVRNTLASMAQGPFIYGITAPNCTINFCSRPDFLGFCMGLGPGQHTNISLFSIGSYDCNCQDTR